MTYDQLTKNRPAEAIKMIEDATTYRAYSGESQEVVVRSLFQVGDKFLSPVEIVYQYPEIAAQIIAQMRERKP